MTPGGSPDKLHVEWAIRMWKRMDRDNSGTLTRKELDCEEMRTVLRMVLVPQDGSHACGGGASYARTTMNHEEALSFCVRKADINNDGILSFEEFKCFTWELRQKSESNQQVASLIFALFDLDSDQIISESEFHEIYRFYLGHHPKRSDFEEEWARLHHDGVGRGVTRDRYMKWLDTLASPIFRRHLFFNTPESRERRRSVTTVAGAVVAGAKRRQSRESAGFKNMTFVQMSKSARHIKTDADGWPLAPRKGIKDRPRWNHLWNAQKNPNDDLPYGERIYFSRSQSLPQLRRFLANHAGCERQHQRLTTPSLPKRLKVVSTDTTDDVMTDPGRHRPGGYMCEHDSGETVLWEDRWQTPLRFKRRLGVAHRPLAPHSLFEASHQHIGPMAPMLNRLYS
jgi:Ca2+-binding EF-hand superfamily protein